jgi:hypothetical protein
VDAERWAGISEAGQGFTAWTQSVGLELVKLVRDYCVDAERWAGISEAGRELPRIGSEARRG